MSHAYHQDEWYVDSNLMVVYDKSHVEVMKSNDDSSRSVRR
jgi:hypothetical protein